MIVSQSRQMKYSGTDSYPRAEDKGTTAERERERERAISASRKLQSGQDALCHSGAVVNADDKEKQRDRSPDPPQSNAAVLVLRQTT